jgi:nucleotide-binding universal stress UspA family protein
MNSVLPRVRERHDERAGSRVFARVLCGSDDSSGGRAAVRLAVRVAPPGSPPHVVSVPEHRGAGPADALLGEIRRHGATLAVVGCRGHSRAVGIALGSVTTFLLHEAPCSVLVARERRANGANGCAGPVVVGVDGSAESVGALEAANELAERLDCELQAVVATRDAHADLDSARLLVPELEEHPASAVDLLAHLSEEAEVVVVGSRGLKGVQSLGSVSERVAHEARCPVLVVRPTGRS